MNNGDYIGLDKEMNATKNLKKKSYQIEILLCDKNGDA